PRLRPASQADKYRTFPSTRTSRATRSSASTMCSASTLATALSTHSILAPAEQSIANTPSEELPRQAVPEPQHSTGMDRHTVQGKRMDKDTHRQEEHSSTALARTRCRSRSADLRRSAHGRLAHSSPRKAPQSKLHTERWQSTSFPYLLIFPAS